MSAKSNLSQTHVVAVLLCAAYSQAALSKILRAWCQPFDPASRSASRQGHMILSVAATATPSFTRACLKGCSFDLAAWLAGYSRL